MIRKWKVVRARTQYFYKLEKDFGETSEGQLALGDPFKPHDFKETGKNTSFFLKRLL